MCDASSTLECVPAPISTETKRNLMSREQRKPCAAKHQLFTAVRPDSATHSPVR